VVVDPAVLGAAPFRNCEEVLAEANRWARLLFARLKLAAASPTGDGDVSPGATLLGGAAPVHAASARADALAAALRSRATQPFSDGAVAPVAVLAQQLALDPLDIEIVLVLAAYQLDRGLQAERAHRTGSGPRLTAGELVELLGPSFARRRAVTERLASGLPLRRFQVVRLGTHDAAPGFGGRPIELHERIVDWLTGDDKFDPRLADTARLAYSTVELEDLPYPEALRQTVSGWREASTMPRRLLLVGQDAGGKAALLAALARAEGRPLLCVDLRRIALLFSDPDVALAEHLREARLTSTIVYLDAHQLDSAASVLVRLATVLAEYPFRVAIGCVRAFPPPLDITDAVELKVGLPDIEGRLALWQRFLQDDVCEATDLATLRDLAQRFLLGHDEIRDAAHECRWARTLAGSVAALGLDELSRAARQRQAHQLGRWAHRIECTNRMEDLVAPEDAITGLFRMILYVRASPLVFGTWGFGRRWSRRAGLSALFHGPSGTGKTMAASLVARELEMDLFRIDLSKITSMWIGESEKHISEVFEQASLSRAILLFDEADSLFAKRTEVKNSTDRYANLGVNFLLQQIEDYQGISILTTNKPENIDEAFKRRLRFDIEFPLPDAAQRHQLWKSMIPPECKLAGRIRFEQLAARYEMGGGSIQNAVLRAAFLAAEAGSPVTEDLLFRAANEEYHVLGRLA
jgi:AAA+ superfamily predicted ATPase